MKKVTYLFLLAAALGACTPKPSNKVETIQPAAFVSIFPKGNAIEGTNFNGTAYLQRLMTDSGTFDVVVSDVIFEPKAATVGIRIQVADSDRHCRERLLSGKREAHTNFESRRRSRYSGRRGALARSSFRQRIHTYSYQHKGSFGCNPVV